MVNLTIIWYTRSSDFFYNFHDLNIKIKLQMLFNYFIVFWGYFVVLVIFKIFIDLFSHALSACDAVNSEWSKFGNASCQVIMTEFRDE